MTTFYAIYVGMEPDGTDLNFYRGGLHKKDALKLADQMLRDWDTVAIVHES